VTTPDETPRHEQRRHAKPRGAAEARERARPPQRAATARRAPDPTAALTTSGLTKAYGEVPALAPLDLTVRDGQRVALVGHNGSGKTTLLRMAAGLLEPTDGTVAVFGQPAGSLDARRAVSYLSDNPTFYEDLSVWEHLEYVAALHGCDESWSQRAADLLGTLGLYDRADDLPTRFSRGLRQKAAIAIGLVRPFRVLLVDEPFVGLDATGREALLELFTEAHVAGATVVVATHELAFVDRVDHLVALRDGIVVHDGTTEGVEVRALVT
jgi:ABC-2 type transport system ATP-binding protein